MYQLSLVGRSLIIYCWLLLGDTLCKPGGQNPLNWVICDVCFKIGPLDAIAVVRQQHHWQQRIQESGNQKLLGEDRRHFSMSRRLSLGFKWIHIYERRERMLKLKMAVQNSPEWPTINYWSQKENGVCDPQKQYFHFQSSPYWQTEIRKPIIFLELIRNVCSSGWNPYFSKLLCY